MTCHQLPRRVVGLGDHRCAPRGALGARHPAVGARRPRPGLTMGVMLSMLPVSRKLMRVLTPPHRRVPIRGVTSRQPWVEPAPRSP
jgi:hypothetical protein